LEQLVLHSIQRISKHIIKDEQGFAEELRQNWQRQVDSKPQKDKSDAISAQRRFDELDNLISGLYENFVGGLLPERQYKLSLPQQENTCVSFPC
jgi:hypothetical protein